MSTRPAPRLSLPNRPARLARALLWLAPWSALAGAQETDQTQTPNTAGAGIARSWTETIGAGRGDVFTPDSSAYLIARDPFRAVARGRQVFQRKFTHAQGLGPRSSDGIGDIESDPSLGAGLADSCAACHGRPQGAAGFGGAVFTRPTSRDAPHLFGLGLVEMLADEMTAELRGQRASALQEAAQTGALVFHSLAAKGIGFGSLVAFPDGTLDLSGVQGVDPDLRVRPFFAHGATFSIREFVAGAFDAEMGLEAWDPDLLSASSGADVVTPAGMLLGGSTDAIETPAAASALADPDGDGIAHEIPEAALDLAEVYLLNYFRPADRSRSEGRDAGARLMQEIGCTSCHVPELRIEQDRRLADVRTVLDEERGNPFNRLYATATTLFDELDDGSGLPTLKLPRREPFLVRGFFSDLKRHDLGPGFWEERFDGSLQRAFVTEPLWGVGSTPPYGHDGRSPTLEDVILRHGGEAQAARDAFAALGRREREQVLGFLGDLVLFSPPATASNLDPQDPTAPDHPLRGHGSIKLAVLFEDPTDPE